MPDTHYLGTTKNGQLVSRKSTNGSFTHAAVPQGWERDKHGLPSFGKNAAGAARNFATGRGGSHVPEIVEVRKVDAAEFRAATSGKPTKDALESAARRAA